MDYVSRKCSTLDTFPASSCAVNDTPSRRKEDPGRSAVSLRRVCIPQPVFDPPSRTAATTRQRFVTSATEPVSQRFRESRRPFAVISRCADQRQVFPPRRYAENSSERERARLAIAKQPCISDCFFFLCAQTCVQPHDNDYWRRPIGAFVHTARNDERILLRCIEETRWDTWRRVFCTFAKIRASCTYVRTATIMQTRHDYRYRSTRTWSILIHRPILFLRFVIAN